MKNVGPRFLFLIFCFLLFSHVVYGSVYITEVMYDLPGTDTDREWVEVYNDSTEVVDLSGWKFFDGSNHNLVPPPENSGQGSIIVPGEGIAILASDAATFLTENQSFTGTVIDTVMSLGNTGDTLKLIKDDGSISFETTYTNSGGQGDGNSLSLKDLVWNAGIPTPGQVNVTPSSETQPPIVQTSYNQNQKQIEIFIEALPSPLFSGVSYTFTGRIIDRDGLPITGGWFVWSFGNGEIKTFSHPETFEYTYLYPGTYALTFSYYYSSFYPKPVVTKQIAVTVVSPDITFGTLFPDGSLEIKNEGANDIAISGWKVRSGMREFIFPTPTVVLSGKSIVLPQTVSGFSTNIKKSDLVLISAHNQNIISQAINTQTPAIFSTAQMYMKDYPTGTVLGSEVKQNEDLTSVDITEERNTSELKFLRNEWSVFFLLLLVITFFGLFFLNTKDIKKSPLEEEVSQFTITEIKEN